MGMYAVYIFLFIFHTAFSFLLISGSCGGEGGGWWVIVIFVNILNAFVKCLMKNDNKQILKKKKKFAICHKCTASTVKHTETDTHVKEMTPKQHYRDCESSLLI